MTSCEHYITSETEYRDYFRLDDLQERASDEYLYKLKFYLLGKKSFKYRLLTPNDIAAQTYLEDSSLPAYESIESTTDIMQSLHRTRRMADSGWSWPETSSPSPTTAQAELVDYSRTYQQELSQPELPVYSTTPGNTPSPPPATHPYPAAANDYRSFRPTYQPDLPPSYNSESPSYNTPTPTYQPTDYTPTDSGTEWPTTSSSAEGSHNSTSNAQTTPTPRDHTTRVPVHASTFHGNQPNEVLVEIFKSKLFFIFKSIDLNFILESTLNITDGTFRAGINGKIVQQATILNVHDIKYYSFAAINGKQAYEFFHNCV